MRSVWRAAALAGVLLGSGAVLAQHKGDKAPGFDVSQYSNADANLTLEKYAGRIVVLVFWRSKDLVSLDAIPLLNRIHKDYGSKGVVLVALTREAKKQAEAVVKARQIEFVVGYEAGKVWEDYHVPGEPYVYLIDPAGKVFWRGGPGENLEDRILECRRKSPPIGSDLAALENRLRKAERLRAQREYGKAYTLAKDLAQVAADSPGLGDKARALVEELKQDAQKWLEQAKQARRSGDYETACRIVAEVSVRFEGTDVAHDADELIARLRSEIKTKLLVRGARENAQAEVVLDRGADFEASKQYLEALATYAGLVEKYPETKAAQQAQERIDKIKSDPLIQAHIRKARAIAQADRWLDLADRFAKVEMYDMARAYYNKVISEQPTSPAAAKAKQRLKDLPEATAEGKAPPGGGGR